MNATAEHEARHCAAAFLLGIPVEKVTTISVAQFAGSVTFDHDEMDRDYIRRLVIVVLVGYLDDPDWPPWPPSPEALEGSDERVLSALVKALDLDEKGWRGLVIDAYKLAGSHEFGRHEHAIAYALELMRELDRRGLSLIHAIAEGKERCSI